MHWKRENNVKFNIHLKCLIDLASREKFSELFHSLTQKGNKEYLKMSVAVYTMDFLWALFMWTLYMDFVCDLYIYLEWSLFLSSNENKHASNTTMATRISIVAKLQILISMMKVIWLNDGKNGNKVLSFTWLPLVWTMIHKCEHYYFTMLGQIYRTFLSIYKTLVRHTRLQWMP